MIEVLAAFVREHSHEPWPQSERGLGLPEHATRPDVQVAVNVIGRRDASLDGGHIDLARWICA